MPRSTINAINNSIYSDTLCLLTDITASISIVLKGADTGARCAVTFKITVQFAHYEIVFEIQ